MDPGLENIIRQALADAQAAGQDFLGQTKAAIQVVKLAHPYMRGSDVLTAIHMVRRLDRGLGK